MLPWWLHKSVFGSQRAGTFDPTSLGVVGAWFDVAEASDAGSGLAFTVPNQLTANHLTTSTDAQKPTISTASNGVPILVASVSNLLCPLHAAINSSTKLWFGFHARLTTSAALAEVLTIIPPSASANKLFLGINPGVPGVGYNRVGVYQDNVTMRRYQVNSGALFPLNTWAHVLIELNLNLESSPGVLAPEADRGVMSIDGVPLVAAFSDGAGTPGALPQTMATPTGSLSFLSRRASDAANPYKGEIGRHIFMGVSAMPGVTSGCLTPAARLALSNFDRPT